MKSFWRFVKGILLKGESSDPSDNLEGSIWHNSTDNEIKSYLDSAIRVMVSEDQVQALSSKSIDADSNTITNIENAEIKAGAAIDASKLADGTVSNAELQYINSLTSNAQDQIDGKADQDLGNLTSPTNINQSLLLSAHNSFDLGSLTKALGDAFSVSYSLTVPATGLMGVLTLLDGPDGVTAGTALLGMHDGVSGGANANYRDVSVGTANQANASGKVYIASGQSSGTTGSGLISIRSGLTFSTGASGPVSVYSGNNNSTGDTGLIRMYSGDALGGNSGNVTIETGTAPVTRGSIIFLDGSESGAGAGAVWTQAAADGIGGWAAVDSANKFLSNLTSPTSVSESLIPSDSTKDLGTLAGYWREVFTNKLMLSDGTEEFGGIMDTSAGSITGTLVGGRQGGVSLVNINTGGGSDERIVVGTIDKSDTTNTGDVYTQTGDQSGASGNSGLVRFETGSSAGGSSGTYTTQTGSVASLAGNSGALSLSSGTLSNVSGSGVSGNVAVKSGSILGSGNSGNTDLLTGDTVGGNSGLLTMESGSSSGGNSGSISVISGDVTSTAGFSGSLTVKSGLVSHASSTQNSGAVSLGSGLISLSTSGSSGTTSLSSGVVSNGSGASGLLELKSGINSGTGNSGDVDISTGTVVSGTRGTINLVDGSEGITGQVWTSTGANGEGNWDTNSAGSGVKSYLDDAMANLESNVTTDFSVYDDTGAYVNGDGGSPATISIAGTNTSGELLGKTYSLKITKAATDGSGEGVTILTRTIEPEDYGRTLWGELEVDFTDANYTSGDVSVHAYDVTNSAELAVVASVEDDSSLPNRKGKFQFYVITDGTSGSETASIRISLHLASDSDTGNAWSAFVDDYKLGPQSSQPGYFGTEPESFIPNFTNFTLGNGTITQANHWRDGSFMKGRVRVTLGSTSAMGTTPQFTVPSGESMDTNFVTADNLSELGTGTILDVAAAFHKATLFAVSASEIGIRYLDASTLANGITSGLPMTWTTNDAFDIHFKIPISGWKASNLVSTQELMISTVVAKAAISGAHSQSGSLVDLDFDTVVFDDFNTITTGASWVFTAPKTAKYRVYTQIIPTTGGSNANQDFRVKVNGTAKATTDELISTAGQSSCNITTTVELLKGDTVSVDSANSQSASLLNDTARNYITIEELPDFSVYGAVGTTELIESSAGATAYLITAGQYGDLTSINLTPGAWEIRATATFISSGATTTTFVYLGVSTTSGNSATGLTEGDTLIIDDKGTAGGARSIMNLPFLEVTPTTTTTYYLKSQAATSISNLDVTYKISARRI